MTQDHLMRMRLFALEALAEAKQENLESLQVAAEVAMRVLDRSLSQSTSFIERSQPKEG